MNKTRNGVRRIPKRPKLPQLSMSCTQQAGNFCPEVQEYRNFDRSSANHPFVSSSCKSSPGCSSPVKIHDDYNIFLGSEEDALDKDFISSTNIQTILSIQSWEIQDKIEGVEYKFIQAKDNAEMDLRSKFEEICDFLNSKKLEQKKVLVHCQAGISRSATACLAYLMKEKNMSLDCSFSELKKRREIVCPNFSFLGQLKRWEQEVLIQ